jgi:hypothetical protein
MVVIFLCYKLGRKLQDFMHLATITAALTVINKYTCMYTLENNFTKRQ